MFKNRVFYGVLLIILMLYSILFDQKTTFLILAAGILFPLITGSCMRIASRKMQINFSVLTPTAYKGEECGIQITIENDSIFPIPMVLIGVRYENCLAEQRGQRVFVASLLGKSTQEIDVKLMSEYAGEISFEPGYIRLFDVTRVCSHRFSRKRLEKIDRECLIILPRQYLVSEKRRSSGYADAGTDEEVLMKPGNDCSEVFGIREYREGDHLSQIHWKLTAKYEKLMMKEYSATRYYYPLILMDFTCQDPQGMITIDLLDAMYEAFMMLGEWQLQRFESFEVMYLEEQTQEIVTAVISQEEELYALLQQLYHSARRKEKRQPLVDELIDKDLGRYSNVYLFSFDYPKILEENPMHHCYVILIEHEEKGFKQELDVRMRQMDQVSMVHPEHLEEDLDQMMDQLIEVETRWG